MEPTPICFNAEEGHCSGPVTWTHGSDGTWAFRCTHHYERITPEMMEDIRQNTGYYDTDDDIDDDPTCICGVHRSEHQLCGCPDGFITPEAWEKEKAHMATKARWDSYDDDYEDDEADLICNKAGSKKSPCAGDVQYWYRPSDGKMFPKCERHAEEANETYRHAQELMSPTPARWFDEAYAGERWSEDD